VGVRGGATGRGGGGGKAWRGWGGVLWEEDEEERLGRRGRALG